MNKYCPKCKRFMDYAKVKVTALKSSELDSGTIKLLCPRCGCEMVHMEEDEVLLLQLLRDIDLYVELGIEPSPPSLLYYALYNDLKSFHNTIISAGCKPESVGTAMEIYLKHVPTVARVDIPSWLFTRSRVARDVHAVWVDELEHVYCVGCCPKDRRDDAVDITSEDVYLHYPRCAKCGDEHDYMQKQGILDGHEEPFA